MPVLIVSEKISPQDGFSRKRVILRVSSTMTTPNSSGLLTRLSVIVANAPLSVCSAASAPRSRSVNASPEITTNGASFNSGSAIFDGACGPERRIFDDVRHVDAEIAAVAEVAFDLVGEVVERRDDLGDAVTAEQIDDMLHHRLVGHRRERFRTARGQRSQSRTLTACHHHRFHPASSLRIGGAPFRPEMRGNCGQRRVAGERLDLDRHLAAPVRILDYRTGRFA